ncbi:MAG TPA: hypothetical protein VHN14_12215 [Kofleriaceae bacterium]|nr:hypothetical protein [Kofleriaceae bacterium]
MDAHLEAYRSLDNERKHVTAFWATVIVRANELAGQDPFIGQQREYLLDRATWAVTEITPAATTKYFRQRYWSFKALNWAKSPSATKSSAGAALRHEHVIERKALKFDLARCFTVADATDVLDRAIACVVTKEESHDLDRAAGVGWSRYTSLRIEVFDRHLRALHPLR